jgi:hypothetical protein
MNNILLLFSWHLEGRADLVKNKSIHCFSEGLRTKEKIDLTRDQGILLVLVI